MSKEWSKVEFQEFINDFGTDIVINFAPNILYSKKDKEHEAYNSLIAFFFISGGLLIYISFSILMMEAWFSLFVFIIVIVIAGIADVVLILGYLKSNIYISPLECWVEIYKGDQDFYCFSYYPVFSGVCHPNKAKNVVYKLYQEEVLKSKVDISQIEVYLKLNKESLKKGEKIGYFYQYGEGKSFNDENINRNAWKYFLAEKDQKENYIAVANWGHQYEWRDDLALDYDKLHEYAPWVIKRWNNINLKPLTEDDKDRINWDKKFIESIPKLNPWEGNMENQIFENKNANKDLEIVQKAIDEIVGDYRVEKLKDLDEDLFKLKAYFRDLDS